jgi:hypothetical protein
MRCTTLFRHIREALDVLAATVPTLRDVIDVARHKAFVILDGTLQGIDRCACLVLATVATSPPVPSPAQSLSPTRPITPLTAVDVATRLSDSAGSPVASTNGPKRRDRTIATFKTFPLNAKSRQLSPPRLVAR